uniref:TRIM8/14/16/25/29/45/65 coiled-coil region domain-containing protein n=1 Tax=Nothobranchius furzeri TaxID=105023 RepID=A0A8C6LL09_NOTFU
EVRREEIQQGIQDREKDVKLLQQEITELKRKDAELKQLSNTEDHNQFLHNYPSVSALSGSPHSSGIKIRPLRYFEDVTAAVSELRDKLQDILGDSWTNVSLKITEVDVLLSEPTSRAGVLRYLCDITLDPNTDKVQPYPDHPNRFTDFSQVLNRESLTGCCYWEVEWIGDGAIVAASYKNMSRAGCGDPSALGLNEKSWALQCSLKRVYLGVYLDHRAGLLSFYSISETMNLLHRVQTTFTQPLEFGLGLLEPRLGSLMSKSPPNPHFIADKLYKSVYYHCIHV